MKELRTVCVLNNKRMAVDLTTPLFGYASVWFTNKRGMVIDTGLVVDTSNKKFMDILRRYPYSFQLLPFQEIFNNIAEYGQTSLQVITSVIEPKKETVGTLRDLLDDWNEENQVNFIDIYSGKKFYFHGLDDEGRLIIGGDIDNS